MFDLVFYEKNFGSHSPQREPQPTVSRRRYLGNERFTAAAEALKPGQSLVLEMGDTQIIELLRVA
jgi:hypothetical protein